jgi:3-isopropylmalate/(R)-2-methylmalate dehydratase small subunit
MLDKVVGKAFVVGHNVDTDAMSPAEYMNYSPGKPEEEIVLGHHAMEGLTNGSYDAGLPFLNQDGSCDYVVVVAGRNFGCGSSREQAPVALKAAGVQIVIADSFARIFMRNAALGGSLLPLRAEESLVDKVNTGDELIVDLLSATVINMTKGETYRIEPLEKLGPLLEIVKAGGLIQYGRKELNLIETP